LLIGINVIAIVCALNLRIKFLIFAVLKQRLFMAALWHRADHYIFVLWFPLLSFYLSFLSRLFSVIADWMSTILPHMSDFNMLDCAVALFVTC